MELTAPKPAPMATEFSHPFYGRVMPIHAFEPSHKGYLIRLAFNEQNPDLSIGDRMMAAFADLPLWEEGNVCLAIGDEVISPCIWRRDAEAILQYFGGMEIGIRYAKGGSPSEHNAAAIAAMTAKARTEAEHRDGFRERIDRGGIVEW